MKPTEPGWYWARFPRGEWHCVRFEAGGVDIVLAEEVSFRVDDFEWGPRVPPPEALLTDGEKMLEHEVARLIDEGKLESARDKLEAMRMTIEVRTGNTDHPATVRLGTFLAFMED